MEARMTKYPISPPASYVTPTAIGFADSVGDLSLVGAATPLPVTAARGAAPAPLAGQTGQAVVAGPFVPLLDVPIHLELGGVWAGQVALQRSSDGGTTRRGVTCGGLPWASFTGNANEVVWQEGEQGASLYLNIAVTSGTVSYRLSQ
jgi:hypothetical protein